MINDHRTNTEPNEASFNKHETLGVQRERWPQLQMIIKSSESLALQASSTITRMLDNQVNNEIAKACDNGLKRSGLYFLVCGNVYRDDHGIKGTRKRCNLFWNALLSALSEQFGGFAVPNDNSRGAVREAAAKRDGKLVPEFWAVPEAERPIGRIWFMVAHAKTLQTMALQEYLDENIPGLIPVFEQVKEVLSDNGQEMVSVGQWRSSSPYDRFKMLRRYSVWRLLCRYQPELFNFNEAEKYGVPPDEKLIQRLHILLSRGSEAALSVEVSMLLRMLAGRYLNQETAVSEAETPIICSGIRYVLNKQSEANGTWEVPLERTNDVQNTPILNNLLPLIHILDLDTDLLRPEGNSLITACRRSLSQARNDIISQEARLRRKSKDSNLYVGIANSLVAALSVSAMVNDRLKDILSDAILNHLGAVDGHAEQSLDTFPNSLKFRDNIQDGVIKPWRDRSSKRPGAILVYGPPGTGKTTIAKMIASELNRDVGQENVRTTRSDLWRYLAITAADFAREGSDGIVACAERVFGELKRVRRCVVLLDEMEEFLRERGEEPARDSRLVTTAFLPLLQETVDFREIILVVATNFIRSIDTAVTRPGRFDMILPLAPPDEEARRAMMMKTKEYEDLKDYLDQRKNKKDEPKLLNIKYIVDSLVKYSMGYTIRELQGFLAEVWRPIRLQIKEDIKCSLLESKEALCIELWRVRSRRIPIALSGRSGSDWRAFRDEAIRFHRYTAGIPGPTGFEDIWSGPDFPLR